MKVDFEECPLYSVIPDHSRQKHKHHETSKYLSLFTVRFEFKLKSRTPLLTPFSHLNFLLPGVMIRVI